MNGIDPCAYMQLTLQHLSGPEREQLEKNLTVQAISIEHHWQLYPEIINPQFLTAARVQCRLQQSQQDEYSVLSKR